MSVRVKNCVCTSERVYDEHDVSAFHDEGVESYCEEKLTEKSMMGRCASASEWVDE